MTAWDRSDTEEVVKGVVTALLVTALAWAFDRLGGELEARLRKRSKTPSTSRPDGKETA